MGKGTDLAGVDSPEHAQLIDDLKDQLLIAFLNRLGGKLDLPVEEIDETGKYLMSMSVVNNTFNFELTTKQ